MDEVFWGPNSVRIYKDYRNLLYIFAPTALRPEAPKYVLNKVHRWTIHMSQFDFIIEHVQDVKNVFADLLKRSSRKHKSMEAIYENISALYQSIDPSEGEVNDGDLKETRRVQQMYDSQTQAVMSPCGVWEKGGRIWILEKEKVMHWKYWWKLPAAVQDIAPEELRWILSGQNFIRGRQRRMLRILFRTVYTGSSPDRGSKYFAHWQQHFTVSTQTRLYLWTFCP